MRTSFPFTAIVGQEDMKQALLIAAVAPAVGGVLVFGDRGSGKTTTVRALADLLPPIETVEGCAYRCPISSPAGLCAACAPEQGHAAPKRLKTPVLASVYRYNLKQARRSSSAQASGSASVFTNLSS